MELYAAAVVVLEDAVAQSHVADVLVALVRLEVDSGRGRSALRVLERAALNQQSVDGYDAYGLPAVVGACDVAQHEVPARPVPLPEVDSVAAGLCNRQALDRHVAGPVEVKRVAVLRLGVRLLLVVRLVHPQHSPPGQRHVGAVDEVHQVVAAAEEGTLLRHQLDAVVKDYALVRGALERSRDPRRRHLVDYDLACVGVERSLEEAR